MDKAAQQDAQALLAGAREVSRAAVMLAVSPSREEERRLRDILLSQDIRAVAIDFGGDFVPSVMRMVERAVSTAKKEGIIEDLFREEGALAGAAHEAASQIASKALGLNVGGKIGIARWQHHVAVALFLCVGLNHLDEVCIGLGHRVA